MNATKEGRLHAWLEDCETRSQHTSLGHPRDPALRALFGGNESAAGVQVDEFTGLNYSAVFRAISIIAGVVRTLPLRIFERGKADARSLAIGHPADDILNQVPNDDMDSGTFRETLTGHTVSWGNGYAEIERLKSGRPYRSHVLLPHMVTPRRVNGVLVYSVARSQGGDRTVSADDMLHLRGLGYDGLVGYSVIRNAADSIGLGLATERFGSRLFRNGARPSGVLYIPKGLDEEEEKRLRTSWERMLQSENQLRTAVLEEGTKWEPIGIPPEDAQFLETRKFTVVEIARWFGIPPHLLFELDRATFSNIESQGLDFLIFCIGPWLDRWERAVNRVLLSSSERRTHYAEHNVNRLVKPDIAARNTSYTAGRNGGWLSVNDIRRLENLDPIGPEGDVYLMPLNMVPAGEAGPAAKDPTSKAAPPAIDPAAVAVAERSLVSATLGRLVRKEVEAAKRAARKPGEFLRWLDEFYPDHEKLVSEALTPVMELRTAIGRPSERLAQKLAAKYCAESREALLDAAGRVEATAFPAAIENLTSLWDPTRLNSLCDQL